MKKTQVYVRKEELDALRKAARRSGRSVAELVREAVRTTILKSPAKALQEFIARRQQKRLLELMGKLEWDSAFDYKTERQRD